MREQISAFFLKMRNAAERRFDHGLAVLSQPMRDNILRKKIAGRRVLILASGPSARDLPPIPKDMLVFACNTSPELLRRNDRRHIDLYIANKRFETEPARREQIMKLLSGFTIDIFLFRNPKFIKRHAERLKFKNVILDRSIGGLENQYYLRKLIRPITVADIVGTSAKNSTTTGIGLLQYALYYKASEVYLLGVDLDGSVRASDKNDIEMYSDTYAKAHKDMDHNVMRILAEKYKNIFAASQKSPLTGYVPHKPLTSQI